MKQITLSIISLLFCIHLNAQTNLEPVHEYVSSPEFMSRLENVGLHNFPEKKVLYFHETNELYLVDDSDPAPEGPSGQLIIKVVYCKGDLGGAVQYDGLYFLDTDNGCVRDVIGNEIYGC